MSRVAEKDSGSRRTRDLYRRDLFFVIHTRRRTASDNLKTFGSEPSVFRRLTPRNPPAGHGGGFLCLTATTHSWSVDAASEPDGAEALSSESGVASNEVGMTASPLRLATHY